MDTAASDTGGGRRATSQTVAKVIGYVLITSAWVAVCLFQVALVGSRVFGTPGWREPQLLLAAGLVYWPVCLAVATVWLTRKRSASSKIMAHVLALFLSVFVWFSPF